MAIPTPQKILLDTDPGGDDCFALLWLLSLVRQERAALVAVTAAAGNVSAELTFRAACQVLELVGMTDIPVGLGVPVPEAEITDAAHIHGADGIGNLSQTLPVSARSPEQAPAADDLLIATLTAAPGEITVIAIGPLNNLAAAETKQPGILRLAREIVVMGGAFAVPGNVTPQAEFNIAFNPVAACTVFASGANLVILPLDITHQIICTSAQMARLTAPQPDCALTRFVTALADFLTQTSRRYRETGGDRGFLVHDAVTIAYCFYPEVLRFRRARVQVETRGELTAGQTLIDRRHRPKAAANAWVAHEVDAAQLFACFVEDLRSLIASPMVKNPATDG
ncbi:MAG: nucleoside hydrolase [Spirulinaceae cyanobacterium SM2_1_0]|nr:nucleoside hydrolase [Spirulinaceae cyanobacterium SM2_1_0]